MNISRLICILVLLKFLLVGCMAVPIPVDYHSPGSRENIGKETVKLFIPEEATIEDVILKLGEPDSISSDGKSLTYGIEKTKLILIWGTFYVSGEGYWEEQHHLELTFDDQGILTKAEFQKKDDHWRSTERTHGRSYPYFVLLPDIPFYQDDDLVEITINDELTEKEQHRHIKVYYWFDRDVFIDPSETEIIRRIFVKKLSEIQKFYKISTPQKYIININKFDCFCHLGIGCKINDPYGRNEPIAESAIALTLEYKGSEYELSGRDIITEDFRHRWGEGYPVEERLLESLNSALTKLEKSLERQVPFIFKDHNN